MDTHLINGLVIDGNINFKIENGKIKIEKSEKKINKNLPIFCLNFNFITVSKF